MGDQSEQHFARFHENGRVSDSELTEIQEGIEGQKEFSRNWAKTLLS